MTQKVEVVLSADDAKAVRAWLNYKNSISAAEDAQNKLTNSQNKSASAAQRQWSALTAISSTLTGIGSLGDIAHKALAQVSAEWDNILQRQEKALNANKTYAQSLETLAFNTAGDATYNTLSKVESEIAKISQETGVGINEVARAVSNAASAKGQLPLEDAFAAVRATLKFAPKSTGLQDVMAGGALDVRKMYSDATPEDAIGFTAMLGQQARITDPAKVAENALPAAILMSKIDKGSLKENAAIYAAITQATGDVQGRTSRTGGIALALQLEKILPELKTTMERVQYLQQNPELAQQFLEGGGKFKGKGLTLHVKGPDGEDISFGTDQASFEKKVTPAIRELLTQGSATDINMRSALVALPELTEGRKVFEKQIAGLKASETVGAATYQQAIQSEIERKQAADSKGAREAAARQGLKELMQAEGLTATEQSLAGWERTGRQYVGGEDPEQAAINTARAAAEEYRSRVEQLERTSTDREGKRLAAETAEKYERVAGSLQRASDLSNPRGAAIRNIEAEGASLKDRLNEARRAGDAEAYDQLRAEIGRLADVLADIKTGRAAPPQVNVLMPGGGAPAAPVAASGIGQGGRP